jgi:hypothetical protein
MGYIIKSSGIIESGTYIPLVISENFAITGTIIENGYYTRIDNIVTCYVYALSNFNFSFLNIGTLELTVPISGTLIFPIGLGSMSGNNLKINIAVNQVSGDVIRFDFRNTGSFNDGGYYTLSFQYEIN